MATLLFHTPRNDFWRSLIEETRKKTDATISSVQEITRADGETLNSAEALVTYGLSGETLKGLPSLRLIAIPMAGINTLPLAELQLRKIAVINAHANGRWVAERALSLLLAAAGRIVAGDRDLRGGRWHGFAAGERVDLSWRSLSEMTVAIVGTGSIGQWTARFLRPLGPEIVGVRRRDGDDGIPSGLFDAVTTDLDDAMQRADAVIVTLPSTAETKGIINSARLAALSGGILVNVGRGDVIDEGALYSACATGSLTAAIDTWFTYPDPAGTRCLPSRYPLEQLDNVIFSPHLGGYTPPATEASAREVVDLVVQWLESGMPADVSGAVDLLAGY